MENKENVRRASDIGRMAKNANKAENGSGKKERRSFKCERLSNIFSTKDSSSSSASSGKSDTKARKINSAPVYRKNSSISQSKFDNDDESSSNTTGTLSDLTMFPFDREAIDYDRIQRECFAVEEEYDNDEVYHPRKSFPYDYDTADDSPSFEALDQKNPPDGIFQQYAMLSQMEKDRQNKKRAQSPAASEMKTLSKLVNINKKLNETSVLIHDQPSSAVTSPIPDLKIDFFPELSSLTASVFSREDEIEKSDALDACQKESTTSPFSSKSNNTNSNTASINLTSNPMSAAVVTTPRATIVVQQVCFHILTFHFLFT